MYQSSIPKNDKIAQQPDVPQDVLPQVHYTPGQSAFNMVERCWSLLSFGVTGVTSDNWLPSGDGTEVDDDHRNSEVDY